MPRDEVKNARVLHGRTVVNLFFESSTRTRTSFEVAGKRLGADVVNVAAQTSSVTKGETLLDTVKNLEALRADAIVLRHPASGAPDFVSRATRRASIVNAGDGAHEHPTQALLDAFTIRAREGPPRGARRRHLRRHPALARRALQRAAARRARAPRCASAAPRTLMPRASGGARPDGACHRHASTTRSRARTSS